MKRRKLIQIQSLPADCFDHLMATWPELMPRLALGGQGSAFHVVALRAHEVRADEFFQQQIDSVARQVERGSTGFATGYVACLSYDQMAGISGSPSRFFYVSRSLVISRTGVYLAEDDPREGQLILDRSIADLEGQLEIAAQELPLPHSLLWSAGWSQQEYLSAVACCQQEIRDGRYYQINLLQYFELLGESAPWSELFKTFAGPFGAWVQVPNLELISFSPERFVRIEMSSDQAILVAEPIKGTAPRSADPRVDDQNRRSLLNSAKDHAELHMIVDLMRNDMQIISDSGSVQVTDSGSLHSFSNVHHLIAKIEAHLRPGLTCGDLLQALGPGGSITGAPKKEVIKAISEHEMEKRGYFMGSICYLDSYHRSFDSSILIRTVSRENSGPYRFAAGSGLTIHSRPLDEWQEIQAKARVVMPAIIDK
ncbi:chorismate-binding protein [Pseudobacteriovorax antillogorgiicola]|uniref:Chorismate binding enzyme n=1 Tax=Pseudobacteriovorax antillogorgiicola TaxID=1513793 RepID=A0A1Y6BL75_9BACT|nr:chorismate-binding protein [Pseudobacteriovorax antillogorgiicola]TCS55357.1 chorismate binding enzyme [Pseudobacteriovorax antillogorgiicola]SMF13587.1 chorismate binding enzyme [Pseudobacteriovorax antillogorgiicola]